MSLDQALSDTKIHFEGKLREHGTAPGGVDWNGIGAQTIRFEQLVRVIDANRKFSLVDYGCGYGALVGYMRNLGWDFTYTGYDILESMIEAGRAVHRDLGNVHFTNNKAHLPPSDYVVASGVFNLKFAASRAVWHNHTLRVLDEFNALATQGFAFNMLTSYSDPERMAQRPDLYFADPLYYFDYCKKHFARNVALLHDYVIYDFTIIVRKDR